VRTVGTQDRSEFESDPIKAWDRGRRLDALLAMALPERPHGVWRARHEQLNRLDDEWHVAVARRLNASLSKPPADSAAPTSRESHAA